MFRSIALSAIFFAAAFQASADPAGTYDLSVLPADVAAQVTFLEQFGDRYAAAIEATIAEWGKPSYTGGEAELDMSVLPSTVAAGVSKLQEYGGRFDAAIRAIFVEATKPGFAPSDEVQQGVDIAGAVAES